MNPGTGLPEPSLIMTDEEHQRLTEYRRRKQLFRDRGKWIWRSLWALPMSLPVPAGPLIGIWWIGYCASRIGAVNAALSGTPRDVWLSCVIFVGLFMMNLVIAFGIVCAACAVILR